jgi:hypothetical protein
MKHEYAVLAKKAGDKAEMTVIEGAGHFEVIAPGTQAWPTVEKAVVSLADAAEHAVSGSVHRLGDADSD